MTARLPYFPFYPKDFASDGLVEAMTTAEVGCYVLLLCKAWHEDPTGTIPADDETLARWCRVSIETWATVKGRVLAPWKLGKDGRWHQGRMKAEADKAQESYARRKKASDVANERRWSPNRIPIASESDRNRTPIGRPSGSQSESESESDKNRERETATVGEIRDEAEREIVWKALDAWSLATRKKPIDVVHNEAPAVHSAMAGWCQAKIPGVVWHAAVLRCIRAAQDSGTQFGDTPKYAIRVVSSALRQWETSGIVPEPSNGKLGTSGKTRDELHREEQQAAAAEGFKVAMARHEKWLEQKKAKAQ